MFRRQIVAVAGRNFIPTIRWRSGRFVPGFVPRWD
jgi:hypothetical protein